MAFEALTHRSAARAVDQGDFHHGPQVEIQRAQEPPETRGMARQQIRHRSQGRQRLRLVPGLAGEHAQAQQRLDGDRAPARNGVVEEVAWPHDQTLVVAAGIVEAWQRFVPKQRQHAVDEATILRRVEDELARRLLRRAELEGRSDDNEASIRTRMHEYKEKTEPLIAYYRRRGVLREVDGLGTVEAVAQRIAQALDGSEGR